MAKDEEEFTPNPDQPIHQGKWTPEEEDYVHGLIEEFKAGLLPLAEGTSLRTFLSKMLNCQPMRISKKFVGSNYNGKQVYVRRKNTLSNDEVRARRVKLQELERKFLAKASPMADMSSADNINAAAAAVKPSSQVDLKAAAGLLGGAAGGMPNGLEAMLAGRSGSSSKAAAAGRALLLGGTGGSLKSSETAGAGTNLSNFSNAELAAELEKRAKSELQTRTSVENFLGSAAELQARASVETLLQNPFGRTGSRSNLFSAAASGSRTNLLNAASGSRTNLLNAARGSFHRGTSASNLLNAALQKNSTSNLLNAARGSFHKNSTSNLLNAARNSFHKNSTSNLLNASAFGRGTSASNLLNASFRKKTSTSNLLNAMASSGVLRKGSTSNLLNAARTGGSSSGLSALLAQRAERSSGGTEGRHSGASLSDLLERHNSMDFQQRVSGLMEGVQAGKNWSASAAAKLGAGGSRSNLANLRLSMQADGEGGASSIFGNASFGGGDSSNRSKGSRSSELAALLKEQGMGAAAALAAAAGAEKESSLSAEMLEKEALLRQLKSAGFDSGTSPIGEYLLKQQLAGGGGDSGVATSASATDAEEAELRHMLELKRKFLSQDATAELEERAAKRLR